MVLTPQLRKRRGKRRNQGKEEHMEAATQADLADWVTALGDEYFVSRGEVAGKGKGMYAFQIRTGLHLSWSTYNQKLSERKIKQRHW